MDSTPQPKRKTGAPPSKKSEAKAIGISVVAALLFVAVFFAVKSCTPAPMDPPTGPSPLSDAPNEIETPESAKPPAARDSN